MKGSSAKTTIRRYQSQIIAIVIWLMIGISINLYMRLNDLSFIEFADEMSHLLIDTWYGPIIYIVVYFLRPLTFFPGTPMTMLAGYEYGIGWGFFYAMIAGLLSTAIPYVTGRWFSDESQLKKRLNESNDRTARLVQTMRENPFQTTLTIRFLYLPYDLVNFAAGSLHISFWSFISATALGNAINAFIMVSIGASLENSLADGQFSIHPNLIIFSLLIWLFSFGITRYLKQQHKETQTI